jgi:hypothetical protein
VKDPPADRARGDAIQTPDHGPCWRMHALGTVPERAGAGQPRYRSEPDPCISAASGAPIGTTSPGGTRSLVLPGQTTCPKWHGPECQVECTPKLGKQEGPAPAPLERVALRAAVLVSAASGCLAGRSALPLDQGDDGHRGMPPDPQGQATEPTNSAMHQAPAEHARLRNRLGWRALAAGVGHASTVRPERFHPGRGRRTRLIRILGRAGRVRDGHVGPAGPSRTDSPDRVVPRRHSAVLGW